jgi:5'-methylthioadenosine phosphorylase
MILSNLRKGVETAKKILKLLLPSIPQERDCTCASALESAVATDMEYISEEKRKELGLFIGKYLTGEEDVSQA